MDAATELADLDEKLRDAETRFARTPGALWLATTAIVESATRLGDELPEPLAERRSDLLVRARRARDDAGPRSSENDVSAITLWVELAEKRAALERPVRAALARVAEHRKDHPRLGAPPASRAALEKALGEREKDVSERRARLEAALDENETEELARLADKGELPPDDDAIDDAILLARSRDARARLAAAPREWHSSVAMGVVLLTLFATPFADSELVRRGLAGVLVAAVVGGFTARDRARRHHQADLVEAHAMRRRDERTRAAAEEDHARLVAAARALGALDAFGASTDGRTLEDRETKLVALAPWIRDLVDGFSADEAARFA